MCLRQIDTIRLRRAREMLAYIWVPLAALWLVKGLCVLVSMIQYVRYFPQGQQPDVLAEIEE